MKKRGEVTLWFLVELIAAFLVAYLAVDISTSYAKGTIFEKLNVAKDIAMQINALYAVPGDAYIITKDLHGYSVKIAGNKIEVYEQESDLVKGVSYFADFGNSNINFNLKNSEKQPKQITILKINSKISFSESVPQLT